MRGKELNIFMRKQSVFPLAISPYVQVPALTFSSWLAQVTAMP